MYSQQFFERRQLTPHVTVVLDIDGTLTPHYKMEGEAPWVLGLLDRISVRFCADDYEYHLLPGVLELIRYLDSKRVNIVFFSAGIEVRNIEFVENLMTHALGRNRFEQIREKTTIFSRNHIIDGTNVKDIQLVYRHFRDIPNDQHTVILVDDNASCIDYQQVKHLLLTPAGKTDYEHIFMHPEPTLLFNQHHSILYIAAMLDECLSIRYARESPCDWLFNSQFERVASAALPDGGATPRLQLTGIMNERAIYERGFNLLRRYNTTGTLMWLTRETLQPYHQVAVTQSHGI